MKFIFTLLDILVLVPTLLFAFYLALLTAAASFKRVKRGIGASTFLRRFVILVPSHDEEAVIDGTLKSLIDIDYPKGSYDIIVIADNCSDRTAEIARASRATVFERFDDINKGKGQALRWCLDRLQAGGCTYDAVVVVDADTAASPNLLSTMNYYLENGAECVQCSTLVTPQPGEWSPEATRIGFLLHNYVRPLGKKGLGLSMGLNGNGMCLSWNLLSRIPWSAYSRVEDLEHALQLVLEGIPVNFAPEAFVHAIMPRDSRLAESQRRRWELARYKIIRKYSWPLIRAAVSKRSIVLMDMLLELITPAFVNLFLFTAAALAINVAGLAVFGSLMLAWITFAYLAAMMLEVFHVLRGLQIGGADRSSYLVLANAPKYAIWKLRLYFKALMSGDDKTWLRTEREQNVTTKN